MTFSSPAAATTAPRKKKDIKQTPAAAKLAAAKPAAETPAAATADSVETLGKAAAVVAHPDNTPNETDMLTSESSDSSDGDGAFFAGVDKSLTEFCAKNAPHDEDDGESDDSSVISIAPGQVNLDFSKIVEPDLLCDEELRDVELRDYYKVPGPCELGAPAFAREFDGTRKELFNELNYGGTPSKDGGRAAAGGGRSAKRARRGAKHEKKRRGWQVATSGGAPSGAALQVATSGAPSGDARSGAAPTVLDTAGTTLGEAQLLATIAAAAAAAEANNEKIARRMQEEEDRGAAAEEGAEEAANAGKVLGEVLGDLGEQAEEIAEAIDAGIDVGSEVIIKVSVIVIVNLPFARDSTRRKCRSRARAGAAAERRDRRARR